MGTRIAAVCLVAFAAGCVSAPPPAETRFQRELAAAIEQMLEQHPRALPRVESAQTRLSRGWLIPVEGVGAADLVDSFGDVRDGRRFHEGMDIFAARGTLVIAAAGGSIARIADTPRGGRCVWMVSDAGYSLYYAHLDRWQGGLAVGDRVRAGDIVGYVGNSGNAANGRCHLHFEIRDGDSPLNPYSILRAGRRTSATVAGGSR